MGIADFKQLQPMGGGGLCRQFCECMPLVELKTVYRTTEDAQKLFLNRIRDKQPDRAVLKEYWGDRVWQGYSLQECVT